jgi:hypothetical protein
MLPPSGIRASRGQGGSDRTARFSARDDDTVLRWDALSGRLLFGPGGEMSKVRSDMAMSVDGFVAGPNQSLDNPFGEGVEGRLHQWMFDEPDANAP